jgi:hypothetical protein
VLPRLLSTGIRNYSHVYATVGAVYDRAFFVSGGKKRAVIDRAYNQGSLPYLRTAVLSEPPDPATTRAGSHPIFCDLEFSEVQKPDRFFEGIEANIDGSRKLGSG